MSEFKCNDCTFYKGDCGHHFHDSQCHILWDVPSESMYDGVIGDIPKCFKPSEEYKKEKDELIIKELARDYSADILKRALEYKTKNDPQISPCVRKKCPDPATCCGCEDYQRWIDEEKDNDKDT